MAVESLVKSTSHDYICILLVWVWVSGCEWKIPL